MLSNFLQFYNISLKILGKAFNSIIAMAILSVPHKPWQYFQCHISHGNTFSTTSAMAIFQYLISHGNTFNATLAVAILQELLCIINQKVLFFLQLPHHSPSYKSPSFGLPKSGLQDHLDTPNSGLAFTIPCSIILNP